MALRFLESFDHLGDATDFDRKWTSRTGAVVFGTGRFGGSCVNGSTSNTRTYSKSVGSKATWNVGFAMRIDSTGNATPLFEMVESSTTQVDIRFDSGTSTLYVTRNGTALGFGSTVLSTGVWYFIELRVVISNTGSYELRINGQTELSNGSVDTMATANAWANVMRWRISTAAYALSIDDIYVADGDGAAPQNALMGDCRVECILPNGNGNSSQFDGSDGNSTDNYLLVDEANSDDDTTYVESPDPGDKDTYAYGNLAVTSGTIYGVQILPYLRKTNAGSRTFVTVARLSATEEDSSPESALDTYIYQPDIRPTRPGGGAWTVSDVNSAEFGVKVNT